jgi:hypothetical protein
MRIRRWITGKRKVVWSEPKLPNFVKINPNSPPGAAQGLQPGHISMVAAAEEFLKTEEDDSGLVGEFSSTGRTAAELDERDRLGLD